MAYDEWVRSNACDFNMETLRFFAKQTSPK